MYFGQWLYFRHCWNCEWCNICVRYNSSLFACLWVKCITFTRLQYNTTTRIDEDATLKGLKNTQNHSVTWTAAVYLYRWFQCDLMRFWMTWEDHTLTIKKKSIKKKSVPTTIDSQSPIISHQHKLIRRNRQLLKFEMPSREFVISPDFKQLLVIVLSIKKTLNRMCPYFNKPTQACITVY